MLTLSQDEIVEITGLDQPAAQLRWLRKFGIRAYRRPDGTVCVLREWLAIRQPQSAKSAPRLKSEQDREQAAQTR